MIIQSGSDYGCFRFKKMSKRHQLLLKIIPKHKYSLTNFRNACGQLRQCQSKNFVHCIFIKLITHGIMLFFIIKNWASASLFLDLFLSL